MGDDDSDRTGARGGADDLAVRGVARSVERDAEMLETLADFPSDRRRPLADTAGKDQRPEAPEHRRVGADALANRVAEEGNRLGRSRVLVPLLEQGFHIRADL